METTPAGGRNARLRRRLLTGVAVVALAATGAVWGGCGDDEEEDAADQVTEAIDTAEEQADELSQEAEEAVDEATQEAEEQIDEAQEQIDQTEEDAGSSGDGY